jgi:hypothetical protein
MFHELDAVVLNHHLPTVGLKASDIGTAVLVHQNGTGYELEFTMLSGETLAVVTLSADALRPIGPPEIAHVRSAA